MKQQLRIIAGRWRGRNLPFPDVAELRPTPARVRETLFNWLRCDVEGARCLDLFAGSGILGFEAASRGALQVWAVDCHPKVCRAVADNIQRIGAGQIEVIRAEVSRFLAAQAPQTFDLVFMDPPFRIDVLPACCRALESSVWLAPRAKVYIEAPRRRMLEGLPENWELLRSKAAGQVACHLFKRRP